MVGGRQAEAGSEKGGEAAPCCAPVVAQGSSGSATPQPSPPLPAPRQLQACEVPFEVEAGGGKLSAVCSVPVPGVTREHSAHGSSGTNVPRAGAQPSDP